MPDNSSWEEYLKKAMVEWESHLGSEPVSDSYQAALKIFFGIIRKHLKKVIFVVGLWFVSAMLAMIFTEPFIGVFFLLPLALGFGGLLMFTFFLAQTFFWQQFAKKRGWKFEPWGDYDKEKSYLMGQGNTQDMHSVILGSIDDRPIRIFSFQFTVGTGKNSRTYDYVVFGFSFAGKFPHLYLNHRRDQYYGSVGETISLPEEFEKEFVLHAPQQYEIEAHQIFNPEILNYILDSNLQHDIELVEGELLVFKNGLITNLDQLEKEFAKAHALALKFAPLLDKFKFEKIGNLSSGL